MNFRPIRCFYCPGEAVVFYDSWSIMMNRHEALFHVYRAYCFDHGGNIIQAVHRVKISKEEYVVTEIMDDANSEH